MKLYQQIRGTGAPLVLVHGWGMNGSVFSALAEALSDSFCVHSLDLPGMGHSPPLAQTDLLSLTRAVADNLPPQAHLLGWSLGGQVAMQFALHTPIRSLTLLASTPRFVNGHDWQCGIDIDVWHDFAHALEQDYQATLQQFLHLQCLGSADARRTLMSLQTLYAQSPPAPSGALQALLQVLLDTDLRGALSRIRVPTLLIHGEHDRLVKMTAAHFMHQHIPHAELQVIAGAGHAPFLSHPQHCAEMLRAFIIGSAPCPNPLTP